MKAALSLLTLLGAAGVLTGSAAPSRAPSGEERMVLLDFDEAIAANKAGDGYPTCYDGRQGARKEGGVFEARIDGKNARVGSCLRMRLTKGAWYAQFNPYTKAGTREFARDYSKDPRQWRLNTYNRMRFWIRLPEGASPHRVDGRSNLNVGTYVKRVANSDPRSDEAGGNHYYHMTNVPALGCWTLVVLNMHPDHRRGNSGADDPGNLPHPTGEADYNYFDALTRFYIQDERPPARHPADYLLDDVEFYREPAEENDEQVYSLTGTHVPASNRVVVTWRRHKRDNDVRHEVRYAFESIHRIGWDRATPAPRGWVRPPGYGGYNGMVYDTTDLPLADREVLYLAIRPENSKRFSHIALPLVPATGAEGAGRPARASGPRGLPPRRSRRKARARPARGRTCAAPRRTARRACGASGW